MYNQIRLISLRLKNPSSVQQSYSCLKFPKDAVANLKTLSAIRENRLGNSVNLPTVSLVKAIRACVPDIASIMPRLGMMNDGNLDSWIISSEPISTPHFSAFFRHWLNAEYPSDSSGGDRRETELKNGAIAAFTADALEKLTGEVILDATQWEKYDNGSAKLDSLTFNLLPDFLATQLSVPGLRFKLQDHWIKFHRCSPIKEGQAELISFPPFKASFGKQQTDFYYSMAIGIEVETVPFQAEPEVRFNIGVRRWVSSEVKKFVKNHAASVYFHNQPNWGKAINSGSNTGFFQVAPLIWRGSYRWAGSLMPLLEQFNPLPLSPTEICTDPVKALNLQGDRNIAITHADGIYPVHRVGKGWFTEDCRQIAEQIIELLQDNWAPIDYVRVAVPKLDKSSSKPYQAPRPHSNSWDDAPPRRLKDEEEAVYQERAEKVEKQKYQKRLIEAKRLREGIVACIGNHLVLEIWYQHTSSRDACTQAVWFNLGRGLLEAENSQAYPDGVVVDSCCFPDEDLTITLIKIEARGIPAALPFSDKKPSERQVLTTLQQRQDEIAQRIQALPEVPGISERGAILEIAAQDQWEKSWLDPYKSCRAAFSAQGRLLQCITQDHERIAKNEGDKIAIEQAKASLNTRAVSSVQDVLRSLGVQATPPKLIFKGELIPDPMVYVGIWLVNRTSDTTINGKGLQLPIAVMLRSDSSQVWITFPGASQNGSIWLPYSQGQIQIAAGTTPIAAETAIEKKKALRKSVTDFLLNVLQSKEIRRGQCLLAFDACNFRQALPWLQNMELIQDVLKIGDMPFTPSNLRIARVRQGDEIADWYGLHSDAKDLIPIFDQIVELPKTSEMVQGLFWNGVNDRVFLSIAQKSSTMPSLKSGYSKLDRPETSWSSPQAVELTMAYLQPGDDPAHWAFLTHQLRSYSLAYNSALIYPIMLDLARQAGKYALLVK